MAYLKREIPIIKLEAEKPKFNYQKVYDNTILKDTIKSKNDPFNFVDDLLKPKSQ